MIINDNGSPIASLAKILFANPNPSSSYIFLGSSVSGRLLVPPNNRIPSGRCHTAHPVILQFGPSLNLRSSSTPDSPCPSTVVRLVSSFASVLSGRGEALKKKIEVEGVRNRDGISGFRVFREPKDARIPLSVHSVALSIECIFSGHRTHEKVIGPRILVLGRKHASHPFQNCS